MTVGVATTVLPRRTWNRAGTGPGGDGEAGDEGASACERRERRRHGEAVERRVDRDRHRRGDRLAGASGRGEQQGVRTGREPRRRREDERLGAGRLGTDERRRQRHAVCVHERRGHRRRLRQRVRDRRRVVARIAARTDLRRRRSRLLERERGDLRAERPGRAEQRGRPGDRPRVPVRGSRGRLPRPAQIRPRARALGHLRAGRVRHRHGPRHRAGEPPAEDHPAAQLPRHLRRVQLRQADPGHVLRDPRQLGVQRISGAVGEVRVPMSGDRPAGTPACREGSAGSRSIAS